MEIWSKIIYKTSKNGIPFHREFTVDEFYIVDAEELFVMANQEIEEYEINWTCQVVAEGERTIVSLSP